MFYIVGLNHLKSTLAQREQLSFSEEEEQHALQHILSLGLAKEVCILSTCNRTEIYYVADSSTPVYEWLLQYKNIDKKTLPFYLYSGKKAIEHCFKVSSGLDSMAIGETQIQSQIKKAMRLSRSVHSFGPFLQRIFEKSFSCSKAVRAHTDIGKHHISIPSACLQIALNIFHDIQEHHVLFIGAGEMIRLCLTYFAQRSPLSLAIANRTRDKAEKLAERYPAEVRPLSMLSDYLHHYDIVITSTGSPLPILTKALLSDAMKKRRHRPMLILDLAVPRDTEEGIGGQGDSFLYTIDDLSEITRSSMHHRREELSKAEEMVGQHLEALDQLLERQQRSKTIQRLRGKFKHIQEKEIEHAQRLLRKGKSPEEVIQHLAHRLTQKFLHTPSTAIQQSEDNEQYIAQLWKL